MDPSWVLHGSGSQFSRFGLVWIFCTASVVVESRLVLSFPGSWGPFFVANHNDYGPMDSSCMYVYIYISIYIVIIRLYIYIYVLYYIEIISITCAPQKHHHNF